MIPYLKIVKKTDKNPDYLSFSFPEDLEEASMQKRADYQIISSANFVYEEVSNLLEEPKKIITLEKSLNKNQEIIAIQREIYSFFLNIFSALDYQNAITPEFQITKHKPWKAEINTLGEKIKIEKIRYFDFKDEVLTKIREILFGE